MNPKDIEEAKEAILTAYDNYMDKEEFPIDNSLFRRILGRSWFQVGGVNNYFDIHLNEKATIFVWLEYHQSLQMILMEFFPSQSILE